MPPRHHRHHHERPPHGAPRSAVAAILDVDALEAILAPWVADPAERRFVARVIVGDGPIHHRGASYVLLRLLGEALAAAGGAPADVGVGPSMGVPLRLPPHLAERARGDAEYPLRLPTAALERLAGGDPAAVAAMAECLTDGPPHHALANAAMVCLLDALVQKMSSGTG